MMSFMTSPITLPSMSLWALVMVAVLGISPNRSGNTLEKRSALALQNIQTESLVLNPAIPARRMTVNRYS